MEVESGRHSGFTIYLDIRLVWCMVAFVLRIEFQ